MEALDFLENAESDLPAALPLVHTTDSTKAMVF
jgi:hypothetical protein